MEPCLSPESTADGCSPQSEGLLLIGHGTREAVGIAEFHRAADLVSGLCPGRAVEPCFLELAEPTIEQGFERIAGRGVTRVTAVPLLLFAAGHAKSDIPAELARQALKYRQVIVRQAGHLGCHAGVLRLSADRYREAVVSLPEDCDHQTLLLMVGRGSLDDMATQEMQMFARLRRTLTPVRRLEVAFAAMARPSLDECLAEIGRSAAAQGIRRVVIQPHLLFGGRLLSGIHQKVQQFAAANPQYQVLVAEHLGASPLLAQAIVERADERAAGIGTISTPVTASVAGET